MKRKSLITMTVVLAPIVAGVAIVVVLWQVQSARAAQEFDEAKQAYIDAGGWASLDEVELPDVPDDENAATLYDTVWPKMNAMQEQRGWEFLQRVSATLPGGHSTEQPLSDDEIAALLDEFDEALDVVKQASGRDAVVWDEDLYDVDATWEILLPWLSPGRRYGNLLCLRAIERAEDGRYEAADDDLRAALRMARHLSEPPFVVCIIVRSSVQMNVLNAIEAIYRDEEIPSESLIDAIERIDPRYHARQAVLFAGTHALMTRQQLREYFEKVVPQPTGSARWNPDADRALSLEMAVHNADLIESPIPTRDGKLRTTTEKQWARLANDVFVGLDYYDKTIARVEAHRRLALTAIGLRRHRAEHGEYPESWSMPDDPVTGEPMQYERTDDGFTLRSDATYRRIGGQADKRLEWRWR